LSDYCDIFECKD
jgi:hypothetical protein